MTTTPFRVPIGEDEPEVSAFLKALLGDGPRPSSVFPQSPELRAENPFVTRETRESVLERLMDSRQRDLVELNKEVLRRAFGESLGVGEPRFRSLGARAQTLLTSLAEAAGPRVIQTLGKTPPFFLQGLALNAVGLGKINPETERLVVDFLKGRGELSAGELGLRLEQQFASRSVADQFLLSIAGDPTIVVPIGGTIKLLRAGIRTAFTASRTGARGATLVAKGLQGGIRGRRGISPSSLPGTEPPVTLGAIPTTEPTTALATIPPGPQPIGAVPEGIVPRPSPVSVVPEQPLKALPTGTTSEELTPEILKRVQPPEVTPPAITPTTSAATMQPEAADGVLDWFGKLISSPEQVEASALTKQWRREALAARTEVFQERVAELVSEGIPPERAIRQARNEALSGELPRASTSLPSVATPEIRDALFKKVYDTLGNEPLEMVATAEALTNALLGKPIPRKLGTGGGSAFTRLMRVFGRTTVEALEGTPIEELIAMRIAPRGVSAETKRILAAIPTEPPVGGRSQVPLGLDVIPTAKRLPAETRSQVQREMDLLDFKASIEGRPQRTGQKIQLPKTPVTFRQPFGQARLGEPPFVIRDVLPDVRVAAERELDLQAFKTLLAEAPEGVSEGIRVTSELDNLVFEQIMLMPERNRGLLTRVAKSAGLNIIDLGNLIRGNMASFDLSWWRQVAPLLFGNPRQFTLGNIDSLRAVWSREFAEKVNTAIQRDPIFPIYDSIGADFLRPLDGGVAQAWQRTEEFMVLGRERPLQRFAERLPWLRISARAHITGINSMLWRMFKRHASNLYKQNEKIASGDIVLKAGEALDIQKELKAFATMLADMSGRGPVGPLKSITPALNAGFFSFRMASGRAVMVRSLFSSSKYTRKEAWKNMVTFLGGMGGLLLAGEQMGLWEVEKDPRNSDFMKARVGRLRIDPWGGTQQFVTLLARLITGTGISSQSLQEFAARDRLETVESFIENKKHPFIGIVLETLEGRDFRGREINNTDWETWVNRITPLAIEDMWEAFEAEGFGGALTGASGIVGAGVLAFDIPTWPDVTPYYGLTSNKERRRWREIHPEQDAKLFILGRFTTVLTARASKLVLELMVEHRIKPEHVRGYEQRFGTTPPSEVLERRR